MATGLTAFQVIMLTLLAAAAGIDPYISGLQLSKPVIAGFLAGIIMGDIQTGLIVGSTLQLMVLGVGTFGGASIPDFASGAIIGTALGVVSGKGIQFAIGLSVPVGLLMVQLDVFARFCNVYFLHRADKHIANHEFAKVNTDAWLSLIPIGLSRAIPVGLSLFFGNGLVKVVLKYAPDWLMGGLRLAGAVLPVVGIAILLHYLPVKRFIPFLIMGYLLAAYLKIPMMGIALFGLVFALLHYSGLKAKTASAVSAAAQGGQFDDDEDEL